MKKTLLIGSLLTLGLVAVVVAAPDFSGTWVIDKAKSDAPQGGGGKPSQVQDVTMIIKQSGNDLAITTQRQEGSQDTKYTLDGKENKNRGPKGRDSASKATLQGNDLVIETTMDIDSGPATTKAVYSLSDGSKVLTVTSTRGERTSKQVFNKQ
jgi:hypothetical protein